MWCFLALANERRGRRLDKIQGNHNKLCGGELESEMREDRPQQT